MDLKILKDEELIALIDYTETITDAVIPDMLFLIPLDCMETLMSTGDTQKLPHLTYIDINLFFIIELEKEMNQRGLLEAFCSKKAFVNYETATMYTYENYSARYAHLCHFKKEGLLDLERVIEQTEKAKTDYERILKDTQEKNKKEMN